MRLTPQLMTLLRDIVRTAPLGADEYRRIPRMGLHYLTRGDLKAAARDPSYIPLIAFRIDGDRYALCVPAS